MTADTLIVGAMDLVGNYAPGEPIAADEKTDALRRLNNMVSGWRTQSLIVLAVERNVFPLVANKQTYTIGIGGDFNVPRPIAISGAGLWMNALAAAQTVTITRSGSAATVLLASHGLAVGDETLIAGANELEYNGLQTIQTVPTANTFTFTVEGTPDSPASGTITSSAVTGQPIEIPRQVITDDAYQSIRIKNLPNSLFTAVYYNPTVPFGTIYLWPQPDTALNQLVLYLQNQFTGFADLDTDYVWPDTPGYGEMCEYNLARRLWTVYHGSVPVPDEVNQLAREATATVKRANLKLSDLENEAAWAIGGNRRWGYNINVGGN